MYNNLKLRVVERAFCVFDLFSGPHTGGWDKEYSAGCKLQPYHIALSLSFSSPVAVDCILFFSFGETLIIPPEVGTRKMYGWITRLLYNNSYCIFKCSLPQVELMFQIMLESATFFSQLVILVRITTLNYVSTELSFTCSNKLLP